MESGRELIGRICRLLNPEFFDGSHELVKFEARLIAEKVTGDSFTELFLNGYDLTQRQQTELESIVTARNTGMPLAYVLKSCEFRGLDLYVDERVLIPRSETEMVVQEAIDELMKMNRPQYEVVDLGTGSGAIAYSIANEVHNADIVAADISPEAVFVAKLNGSAVGSVASRVRVVQSDLFEALPVALKGNIDLIVSNPPYIGLDELEDLEKSVSEFEPHLALFSGVEGVEHYKRIISESIYWLKPNSKLVLEIAPRHVGLIKEMARSSGYMECQIKKDFSGRERVSILSN